MTTTVTIMDLRKWIISKFATEYMYLPHLVFLPWSTIGELVMHKRSHYFALKDHAPKALLVGYEKNETSSSIWAVLNMSRQEIHYYKMPKDGSMKPWSYSKSSSHITLSEPLQENKISSEALLIYYFLEFRAVKAWNVDARFFHDLEEAFRKHVTKEKQIFEQFQERDKNPTITLNSLKNNLETCFGPKFRYICEFNQVIRMGNAVLIGTTVNTHELPVYAFPS